MSPARRARTVSVAGSAALLTIERYAFESKSRIETSVYVRRRLIGLLQFDKSGPDSFPDWEEIGEAISVALSKRSNAGCQAASFIVSRPALLGRAHTVVYSGGSKFTICVIPGRYGLREDRRR